MTSAPARSAEPPPAPVTGSARIEGQVFRADAKTPEAGAILRLCSLEDGTLVGTGTSDAKGEFALGGLVHGFAELTVEAGGALYVANQIVRLSPTSKQLYDLVLVRDAQGVERRASGACVTRAPSGSAELRERATAGSFARSKKGIALITGLGAVALIAVVSGGGSESSASAFTP